MSRNYNLRSRDMAKAVKFLLKREALNKNISFASASTLGYRFCKFKDYIKQRGINRLEHVTREHVIEYGKDLAVKIELDAISIAYSQNLVSALNTIFQMLRGDEWSAVNPTKDCGIPKRTLVRVKPTISMSNANKAIQCLKDENYAASLVAELALSFGMRAKEASLFNAKYALKQILKDGKFAIEKGTKGGRKRSSFQIKEEHIELLKKVEKFQGNNRSLMPSKDSWKSWGNKGLRKGRSLLHSFDIQGYHQFRALFAANYYKSVTTWDAPVNGGVVLDKQLDERARLSVAEMLGHKRVEIASAYIGSRK